MQEAVTEVTAMQEIITGVAAVQEGIIRLAAIQEGVSIVAATQQKGGSKVAALLLGFYIWHTTHLPSSHCCHCYAVKKCATPWRDVFHCTMLFVAPTDVH